MIHAVFIDNDQGSLVLFEEISRQYKIQYTGIINPDQVEQVLSQLLHLDIIFLDLEMPKYNGYDILKLIRSHEKFQSISVVACTVYSDEIERARNAGFDSFIVKPIDVEQFPLQLQAILQGEAIWETH